MPAALIRVRRRLDLSRVSISKAAGSIPLACNYRYFRLKFSASLSMDYLIPGNCVVMKEGVSRDCSLQLCTKEFTNNWASALKRFCEGAACTFEGDDGRLS